MAVKLKSVYKLFHMSGDIVYALLFPQLTAAMYMPTYVNWFGSTMAFITGVLLRFLSGEPFLGIDAVIEWPGFLTGKFYTLTDFREISKSSAKKCSPMITNKI